MNGHKIIYMCLRTFGLRLALSIGCERHRLANGVWRAQSVMRLVLQLPPYQQVGNSGKNGKNGPLFPQADKG
jgi:hypothetical protein